jgi:WD40 repeat protein
VRLSGGDQGRDARRPLEELPAGLREVVSAVKERAVLAGVSEDGRRVVLTTPKGTIEVWDPTTGQRLATAAAPPPERLQVVGPGFVTLADGRVTLWRCAAPACQPETLVAAGATALAADRGGISVAVGSEVQTFSAAGARGRSEPLAPGATALLATAEHLVAGFPDGSIDVRPRGRPGKTIRLADSAARPVTVLTEGPLGTVAAGHANGAVGVWNLADGRLLDQGKLHGPILHLVIHDGQLFAATEIGDHLTWNLDGLRRPYCDLLAEVWAQVPVVWEGERPVRRPPPPQHPCASRGGRR